MPKRTEYEVGYQIPGTYLKYVVESEQIVVGIRRAIFDCKCGNYFISEVRSVISNSTKSCGCHRRETIIRLRTKHGQAQVGKISTTYKTWCGMNSRAGKRNNYWHVKVCDRWSGEEGFQNFLKDMGERPHFPNNTLERIDGTKGYFKENCKWTSQAEQTRNTTRNVFITLGGETKVLSEWCRFFNITPSAASDRHHKLGWSWEETFFTPYVRGKQIKRI